jgi:hypothetical protein
MIKKIILYPFFLLITVNTIYAQNNNSPYSIVGLGDIEQSYFDRTAGMGNTGLAISSNRFMYNGNPAANASLDFHYFSIELAGRYKGVNYSGTPVLSSTQQSTDLQMKKLLMAVKPKSFWAVSLGLLPFSTVNYSMYALKYVQGTPQNTLAYYKGDGGTNQFFITNSFRLNKHFSIGVQASYIFGHLNEQETIIGTVSDSTLTSIRYITINKPFFKFGAQYKTKVSKNWDASIGGTLSNKTKINADYSLVVTDGNTVLRSDIVYKSSFFTIPIMYAGGVSATYKDKYTFAADFNHQDWGTTNISGISYNLVNSNRYSVGAEYSNKVRFREFTYEKYFLQAGTFYNNSYLKINGTQIDQFGVTFGAGLQTARGLGFQAALEIGRRGTTNNNLIKENYNQLTFTLSYRDFWRSKKLVRYD